MRHRTLAISIALTLAIATSALAAGPLKGRTYQGGVPSTGISNRHHRVAVRAGGNVVLRVSGNGRSVSVRFSSPYPVLYCNTSKTLKVQRTKPARISGSGSFRASITQRFQVGPGPAPITQVISGRFSGRRVSGTIETQAAECGGRTSFSAKA